MRVENISREEQIFKVARIDLAGQCHASFSSQKAGPYPDVLDFLDFKFGFCLPLDTLPLARAAMFKAPFRFGSILQNKPCSVKVFLIAKGSTLG